MTDEGAAAVPLSRLGAQPLAPEDPRRIGAFPLRAVLGSGGMGRVYLGLAPTGYTAVKRVLPFLAADQTFLRHFSQELDNQARLPAGVSARLLAADRTARPPWFATEYIPGVTLHDSVHLEGGALPGPSLWLLLRELADRLRVIHSLSMMHRDLKPSNVMLTHSGVTLIDFGVARAADQSALTATGVAVGTPAFMAPEQAKAERTLTPAVDVFSLGGVMAFAASAQPPFGEGSGHDVFYRIVHQEPDLSGLAAVDPALAALVQACLAKEPADRPSAAELVDFASANVLPGPVLWPSATTERIAVRRAFAAAAPVAEFDGTELEASWIGDVEAEPAVATPHREPAVAKPVEAAAVETEPLPPQSPGTPVVISGPGSITARPPRRSRKTLTLLLPLLLVLGATTGTLLAMNKMPWTTHASGGNNDDRIVTTGTPSASAVAGTATPTSTGSLVPAGSTVASHAAKASSAATTKSTGSGSGAGGSTGGSGSGGSSGGGSGGTTTKTTAPAGSKPNKVASFNYNYGSCFGACDPYPLVISWKAQSDATSYDIHYQNTTRSIDVVIHVSGTSYTINTTNSGDHVCLQMRAVNQYGDSAWNPQSPACFDMPY